MPLIDLSTIVEAIISIAVAETRDRIRHHEAVLKVRRKLQGKLVDPEPTFDSVYVHALIEYGIGKPRLLLELFGYSLVQDAFRESFPGPDWTRVKDETQPFLETHEAGVTLRRMDIDPTLEIARFSAVFNAMVQRSKSPAEVWRDQTLSDVVLRLEKLDSIDDVVAKQNDILAELRALKPRLAARTSETPVFISYSRKDGRDFAHALRAKLEVEGFTIWHDVISETPGEGWWQNIVEAIENSAVMVLIFTEGALRSQVVRDEWLHARKAGTAILPVMQEQGLLSQLDDRGEQLVPPWLDRLHLVILDPLSRDYEQHWQRLLGFLYNPPPRRPVPFTVPPLPDEFVHRDEHERLMLKRLVADDGLSPRPGRKALIGEGGFGKTTLVQAVCRQPQVLESFKDGVLWLTLGEDATDATVIQCLNEAVQALGGALANTLSEATRRYADFVGERDCLIVLDDIWQADLIEPFLIADAEDPDRPHKGKRAWLITSRFEDVTRYIKETEDVLRVYEMEKHEAAQMLSNFLPADCPPLAGQDLDELGTLVGELGEWPLLLRLAGNELHQEMIGGAPFERALTWVKDGLKEEGLVAFDVPDAQADPGRWRQQALSANVALSLRRFSEDEQHRLFELTIFPPDTDIPVPVALRLWKLSAQMRQRPAQTLLRRFAGALLRLNRSSDTFNFHDVMRTYLGKRLETGTHAMLLDGYNPARQPWHTVSDDGYLYENLAYHLLGAGEKEELIRLLTGSPEWMEKKYTTCGSDASYFGDLELAINTFSDPISMNDLLSLIQLTTAKQLVYARTSNYTDVDLQTLVWLGHTLEALSSAQLRFSPLEQFCGLVIIYRNLSEKGEPNQYLLSEMQRTAQQIHADSTKGAWALCEFAEILSAAGMEEDATQAIERVQTAVNGFQEGNDKSSIYAKLAVVQARIGKLSLAKHIATAIEDKRTQCQSYSQLAIVAAEMSSRQESFRLFEQAEAVARSIDNPRTKMQAFGELAGALSLGGIISKAETLVDEIKGYPNQVDDYDKRQRLLEGLVWALITARRVDDAAVVLTEIEKSSSAYAFSEIGRPVDTLEYLPFKLAEAIAKSGNPDKALVACEKIPDDDLRGLALREVAAALARNGRTDEASWLLDNIRGNHQLVSHFSRQSALRALSIELVRLRQFNAAEKVARLCGTFFKSFQREAMRELADELERGGYVDRAKSIRDEFESDLSSEGEGNPSESDGLYDSILGLIHSNSLEKALMELSRANVSDFTQIELLGVLGRQLSKIEDPSRALLILQRARQLARNISDPWMRAWALGHLGVGAEQVDPHTASGLFMEAREIALEIPDWGNRRSAALSDLSDDLARARRFVEARELAQMISNDFRRDYAMRNIALELASSELYCEAFAVLGQRNPYDFIRILLWMFSDFETKIFLQIIWQVTRIMSWMKFDWHNIHKLLTTEIDAADA